MPDNPSNFDFDALMAEFDLEKKMELQQLETRLTAATRAIAEFEQTIGSSRLPTFEEQFASDLAADCEAEEAYLANVPSTEQAQMQFEQVINESRPPTFEDQFASDLAVDREAEEAYLASVPSTEQAQKQFEQVINESRPPTFEDQFASDLATDREAEEAYLASVPSTEQARMQFEQVINESRPATFEDQFASDLAADREAEEAYLANVPSTEQARMQFEQVISESRPPTFEDQFASDLAADREAEEAYLASVPSTEQARMQFEQVINESRPPTFEEQFVSDLAADREAEEVYLASVPSTEQAQMQFEQVISESRPPTFEEQFASDLAADREAEEAYLANVPSTEQAQMQFEQVISESRLPTFEEMFAKDLELDRQAEQAWMDRIPTLEEVNASFKEIIKQSKRWHNLVRAEGANILLHIVDYNYSENNYRQLLGVPEFADEKYIPIYTPDDPALLSIHLDFGLKNVVKLNTAGPFISLAQTKQFTIETPHTVSIDELHVKALTIKQFLQIHNPNSNITLQDFIDLSASGPIILGKVLAGDMIRFYSPIKIAALQLQASKCYLNSVSDIEIKTLVFKQLLEAHGDRIKLGEARSLDELKLYAKQLQADSLYSASLEIRARQVLADLLEGTQLVDVVASSLKAKAIRGKDKVKLHCNKLEIEDLHAKDCELKIGSHFTYTDNSFQGIQNKLNIIFGQDYSITQNVYADQLQVIYIKTDHVLQIDAEINIKYKLVIEASGLKQNKPIKAGSVEFRITGAFESCAPIIVREDAKVTANSLQQSSNGYFQSESLNVHVINGALKGSCKAKNLQLIARNSLQYNVSKWVADNYDITVPESRYAKFPQTVAGDYKLNISNPAARGALFIPKMHLGGQLNINADHCHIAIKLSGTIVAQFILINGRLINLANTGLFALNGITLNAFDGFTGLNDGTYIRTLQGDIKLSSEGSKINLSHLEIVAMRSGNILLRARNGVSNISGKLQTVNGDVILQSPQFLMGLNYHELPSESRGNNSTRTGGVKVTSRPAELVARRLLLSGFNPGERCLVKLIGSICCLQELPQNREKIQCESVTDHEDFDNTRTESVWVGATSKPLIGGRKGIYEDRTVHSYTTTTHATYTAELIASNHTHVNLTKGDHRGLILAARQNTVTFGAGTVFNSTPQANDRELHLNVGLDEVIHNSVGGFYTFMPNLQATDFIVPELGNRYSMFIPLVNIPLEEKYPMILGLNRHGKLQIMPRRSVMMYHHLGQELENFHLILHKQYPAALSVMPNPEMLYWQACRNGALAIGDLQRNYAGGSVSLDRLEAKLIDGDKFVVFYREQLVPGTTQNFWFMRSIMPLKMYQKLTENYGKSGIYGQNVSLCGMNSEASLRLIDNVTAQANLEMQNGHVEFVSNTIKAGETIRGELNSFTINDAEVIAGGDIGVATELLRIIRRSAHKVNLSASNDIALKSTQYEGNGASFKAGHDLITLFEHSENLAQPIHSNDGSVTHLVPKLDAGNAVLWQVAGASIHEAPHIIAKKFKEFAGQSVYLAVSDIHRKAWKTTEKSGWGPCRKKRDVEHVSIDIVSRGAQFDVQETVEIIGAMGIKLQQVTSMAQENLFVAPDAQVELLAGCHMHESHTQTHKRNLVWQKHQVDTVLQKNYTPCEFKGKLKIIARSACVELLANNPSSNRLFQQIQQGFDGELAVQYLYCAYEHHCEKHQGPTVAAAALVAIAIAALTMGAGAAILASAGGATSAGATAGAAVGAGVTAGAATASLTAGQMVTASVIDAALASSITTVTLSLAQNGGDIGKALRELGSSKNIRSLLTSVTVAGLAAKFIEPLKQSKNALDAVIQVEQTASLFTKIERALMQAGISVGMSRLIERKENRTKLSAAIGGAIAGAVADHLDFGVSNKQLNCQLSKIEAKLSKALIGGLGASVVGGKRVFVGGALGALVADLDLFELDENSLNPKDIAKHAKAEELLAGFSALLTRQDVGAAACAAGRVAENHNYARVLQQKLKDLMLIKELMQAVAKDEQNSTQSSQDNQSDELHEDFSAEQELKQAGMTDEAIDELNQNIQEYNKAVLKATDELEKTQDLSETFDDNEQTISTSSSSTSGLFFSSESREIQHPASVLFYANASADNGAQTDRFSGFVTEYSQVDIALQQSCRALAGTLKPHVDKLSKFVEAHPYAMDAINLAFLTAAFMAGGIPGVLALSLRSSIAMAGEEVAKDLLVSRGVNAKDAAIVVGAIALSMGAKGMVKGSLGIVKKFSGKILGWFKKGSSAAVDVLGNAINKLPKDSMVTFQHELQQRAAILATRDAKAAKTATNKVKQKELNKVAKAKRKELGNNSKTNPSTVGLNKVIEKPKITQPDRVKKPVDSTVKLKSLRNPAIRRDKLGITDITGPPSVGGQWGKQDLISKKDLASPKPATIAETDLVTQWAFIRKAEIEKLNSINLNKVSKPLEKLIDKAKAQLTDHMQPKDLLAIAKENRDVKILKSDGTAFDHIGIEWRDAKRSFENFLAGRSSQGITEKQQYKFYEKLTPEDRQVWKKTSGKISDLWDQYKDFIEKAKKSNQPPKPRME